MVIGVKISDVLLEARRQRHIDTMFHGTSSVFLQSILKHGLQANPKKRVYTSDKSSYEKGQATFPNAVYLTKDMEIAKDACFLTTKRFGGEPMILIVKYVKNSTEMDEDQFVFDLVDVLREAKSREDFVKNIMGLFNGMKFNETIVSTLFGKLYDFMIKRITDNDISLSDGDYAYGLGLLNLVRGIEFDNIVSKILSSINPKDAKTLRIPRDIGFSGKTKIVEIFNPESGEVYYIN